MLQGSYRIYGVKIHRKTVRNVYRRVMDRVEAAVGLADVRGPFEVDEEPREFCCRWCRDAYGPYVAHDGLCARCRKLAI